MQKERHSELAVFIAAETNTLLPVGYLFFLFLTLTFHMPSTLITLPIVNIYFCKIVTKEKLSGILYMMSLKIFKHL